MFVQIFVPIGTKIYSISISELGGGGGGGADTSQRRGLGACCPPPPPGNFFFILDALRSILVYSEPKYTIQVLISCFYSKMSNLSKVATQCVQT